MRNEGEFCISTLKCWPSAGRMAFHPIGVSDRLKSLSPSGKSLQITRRCDCSVICWTLLLCVGLLKFLLLCARVTFECWREFLFFGCPRRYVLASWRGGCLEVTTSYLGICARRTVVDSVHGYDASRGETASRVNPDQLKCLLSCRDLSAPCCGLDVSSDEFKAHR